MDPLIYELPELYDAQYRAYRDDVGFYRRVAHDYGGPLLELGCGTGRLTVEFAREAGQVVGVDNSPQMLERAGRRIEERGLSDRVELRLADMRDGQGPGRFAAVAAPFNTLMHALRIDDQDRTLRAAWSALVPGGTFACDVYVPRFGPMHTLRTDPEWRDVVGPNGDVIIVQEHDEAQQTIRTRYLVDTVDDDGFVRRRRATLVQRYFTRFELERMLLSAGFENVRIYGSFEREPFTSASDTIVALARKPGA